MERSSLRSRVTTTGRCAASRPSRSAPAHSSRASPLTRMTMPSAVWLTSTWTAAPGGRGAQAGRTGASSGGRSLRAAHSAGRANQPGRREVNTTNYSEEENLYHQNHSALETVGARDPGPRRHIGQSQDSLLPPDDGEPRLRSALGELDLGELRVHLDLDRRDRFDLPAVGEGVVQ